MSKLNITSSIFGCLFILINISSCISKTDPPILSGILWGGEGNRMFIKSVSSENFTTDTILIDNMGEFVWNRDTIVAGFYSLEKMDGSKLILFLEPGKSQFIDGLFATFPEKIKIPGTDLPESFLKIENINKEWYNEIIILSDLCIEYQNSNKQNYMKY